MKNCVHLLTVLLITASSLAQNVDSGPSPVRSANSVAERSTAMTRANAALAAHGGEKLRGMKTLIMRGSVDVTVSAFNQAIAGGFVMVISGEKYRIEISNPVQPLKQVHDGVVTSSTIQNGFNLPPVNRLGLPMLARLGDAGFAVTPLADGKKSSGFRITAPDGWFTDFIVDDKTDQIKRYESVYDLNGRTISTIVEIDRLRIVDGVSVPERFAQRFDLGQITAYAVFKAKEILVNTEVADEVFTLGK
jgi:hypothetical protein